MLLSSGFSSRSEAGTRTEMHSHTPLVSICTPTFNRRPFIKCLIQCFLRQDYPKHLMEWLIVDDGADSIEDLIQQAKVPQIQYYRTKPQNLGAKRNFLNEISNGEIIINFDDDDYYPPERVSHAVQILNSRPDVLAAGSSAVYTYSNRLNKMFLVGPFGEFQATAGTFAYKRELLNQTRFNDSQAVTEERFFLKNNQLPIAQLNPLKTVCLMAHCQNTVDKSHLFKLQDSMPTHESTLSLYDFIQNDAHSRMYLEAMGSLSAYPPGDIKFKPDSIKQIKAKQAARWVQRRL